MVSRHSKDSVASLLSNYFNNIILFTTPHESKGTTTTTTTVSGVTGFPVLSYCDLGFPLSLSLSLSTLKFNFNPTSYIKREEEEEYFCSILASILTFQFHFILAQNNGRLLLFPLYVILSLRRPHNFLVISKNIIFDKNFLRLVVPLTIS